MEKELTNKYKNTYETEYELHTTNDGNYMLVPEESKWCIKCGNDLEIGSLDKFCDSECRREYFAEIRHDLRGLGS